MMRIYTTLCLTFLLWLPAGWSQANQISTQGGIKLPQTRVIFHAKDKNTTATIQNQGDNLYLIKASIEPEPGKSATTTPFVVTPPLFRLEPHHQQTVRIVRQISQTLPTDRESVFYLNFLAIPPIPDEEAAQMRVAIGLQTVIKLFYRPTQLPVTQEQAASQLRFTRHVNQLTIANPTPYYLTLGTLKIAGKEIDLSQSGQMIAPFSQSDYPYDGQGRVAYWQVINDYGGVSQTYQAPIVKSGGAA